MMDAVQPLRLTYSRAFSSLQPSIYRKIGAARLTVPSVSKPATKCGATTRISLIAALLIASTPAPAETASFYGGRHHGRLTANGERFNENAFTAAHRTLPFGT